MKTKFLCFSRAGFTRFNIILCTAALMLGGIIYLLFRPSEILFLKWIQTAGLDNWFSLARQKSLSLNLHLPEWIVFSLPNGFWAFAYALLITCVWSGSKSWLRYFWMASIPILVLGFEILQFTGTIPGTFCMQDLALGMAGIITGIIVGTKTIKTANHEKTSE